MADFNEEEDVIEELSIDGDSAHDALERAKPERAKSSRSAMRGKSMYGDRFTDFQNVRDIRRFIHQFKDYYYQKKYERPETRIVEAVRAFNEEVVYPLHMTFFPTKNQILIWETKWDTDIASQRKAGDFELSIRQGSIGQLMKTRDGDDNLLLGVTTDSDLERGVRTLAGELVNDAAQMLRDDQRIGDIYEDEVLIKRRAYILNVFGHVTKQVQGKAALTLKANEEKRNDASFLMTLLSKATAGTLSPEEMEMLGTTYSPAPVHAEVAV